MASKQTYINSKMETIERLSLTVLLLSERIQRRRKMFFSSSYFWFCWHDVCLCRRRILTAREKYRVLRIYWIQIQIAVVDFLLKVLRFLTYFIFLHLLPWKVPMSTTAGRVMALPRPLRGSMKIWYQSSTVGAAASSFRMSQDQGF